MLRTFTYLYKERGHISSCSDSDLVPYLTYELRVKCGRVDYVGLPHSLYSGYGSSCVCIYPPMWSTSNSDQCDPFTLYSVELTVSVVKPCICNAAILS